MKKLPLSLSAPSRRAVRAEACMLCQPSGSGEHQYSDPEPGLGLVEQLEMGQIPASRVLGGTVKKTTRCGCS